MLLGNAGVHIMRSGTFTEITGDAIPKPGVAGEMTTSPARFETGLNEAIAI